MESNDKIMRAAFIVSAVVYGIALGLDIWLAPTEGALAGAILGIYIVSYIVLGFPILKETLKGFIARDLFNENSLMGIASIGAWLLGDGAEAVAIVLFYQVGESLQDSMVARTKDSIKSLQKLKIESIRVLRDDKRIEIPPESVRVGDIVVVLAGERIGVDGIITQGAANLDLSALNGESIPVAAQEGQEVLAGTINLDGVLHIRATNSYADSALSKIIALIEEGSAKKAQSEEFITRFARFYTPAVVGLAALIAFVPPLLALASGADAQNALHVWGERGLIFLVISCPCALVISIPLSFFVSLGAASSRGILIKGSRFLEALHNVQTLVFDKTGTLSKGQLSVSKIQSFGDYDKARLLTLAQSLESHSTHAIAKAILREENAQELLALVDVQEIAGGGIGAQYEGRAVLAGNARFLREKGIAVVEETGAFCNVYLADNGELVGILSLSDTLKDETKETLRELREQHKEIVILSGDSGLVVQEMANALGVKHFYGDLLPKGKVERLQALLEPQQEQKRKNLVAFVGDGINDAPSLALSDVGIAMGKSGSDIALANADIVILDDNLQKITLAFAIARKTRQILWQNIGFALGAKIAIMLLGAFGIANIWLALFGDVGVALLTLLNAKRALWGYRS
ncbi:MAG: cadmium-translocating P-type ATPase [Helicobacter sp.]|nr:cadmium-translocating P-type ATPase [Helicobacter sp.]MDE7447897.1 cadmium-translocating P-type ATPase [Helicobacter sp.]